MTLNVKRIITGPFQENSFIAWQKGLVACLVIDPGDEPGLIQNAIEEEDLEPVAIINTHAHLDHIGAVTELKNEFGISFYLHKNEKPVLNNFERDRAFFGMVPQGVPKVDQWYGSDELNIGSYTIRIIATPGHTPGGTCLVISDHIFTGDTLFAGSVGRTDLPGGNWDTLCSSLVKLMKEIPADYILHPGHGPDTTMKTEMSQNPFLFPLLKQVNS